MHAATLLMPQFSMHSTFNYGSAAEFDLVQYYVDVKDLCSSAFAAVEFDIPT